MITEQLMLPTGSYEWEVLGGRVIFQQIDIAAAAIAALMVTGLGLFFQYTRIGRALRAVADDHQAALSVGISLKQIWVVVWFTAGIVALVTGIMWGARSDVSFALQIVALKALPVLVLGGLTSVPGAIVGGLIIGVGEKLGEIYWGPLLGGGIESWLAYIIALAFLLVRPRVCSGSGSSSACDGPRPDALPRDRPIQDQLRGRQALFTTGLDRIGMATIVLVASCVIPLLGSDFFLTSMMIPFLVFALAAIGLNLLTGYAGQLSLGTGGFMGVGAYACYKLATLFPGANILVLMLASGVFSAALGVLFGLPSPAHQGLLSGGGDAGRAVLSRMVLQPRPLALQLQRKRRHRGADRAPSSAWSHRPERDAARALFRAARHRRAAHLDRLEPRPRPYRPCLDDGARHGRRRRADGHPSPARPSSSPSPYRPSTAASPGR